LFSVAGDTDLCTDKSLDDDDQGGVWTSSTGTGCSDHETLKLCTEDGEAGEGWDASFGDFSDWAYGGMDATQACCACGGGILTDAYHVVAKNDEELEALLEGDDSISDSDILTSRPLEQLADEGSNSAIDDDDRGIAIMSSGQCADKLVESGSIWLTDTGTGCRDYAKLHLCTADGGYGPGWDESFGNFDNWLVEGMDAREACCACGGGCKESLDEDCASSDVTYDDDYTADEEAETSIGLTPAVDSCVNTNLDDGSAWESVSGIDCYDYEEYSLCTPNGEPGDGWDSSLGDLNQWAVEGLDASQACCVCGGGSQPKSDDDDAKGGDDDTKGGDDDAKGGDDDAKKKPKQSTKALKASPKGTSKPTTKPTVPPTAKATAEKKLGDKTFEPTPKPTAAAGNGGDEDDVDDGDDDAKATVNTACQNAIKDACGELYDTDCVQCVFDDSSVLKHTGHCTTDDQLMVLDFCHREKDVATPSTAPTKGTVTVTAAPTTLVTAAVTAAPTAPVTQAATPAATQAATEPPTVATTAVPQPPAPAATPPPGPMCSEHLQNGCGSFAGTGTPCQMCIHNNHDTLVAACTEDELPMIADFCGHLSFLTDDNTASSTDEADSPCIAQLGSSACSGKHHDGGECFECIHTYKTDLAACSSDDRTDLMSFCDPTAEAIAGGGAAMSAVARAEAVSTEAGYQTGREELRVLVSFGVVAVVASAALMVYQRSGGRISMSSEELFVVESTPNADCVSL
jgi:hypothetical protein